MISSEDTYTVHKVIIETSRALEPAGPQGLVGFGGRGSRRGALTLGTLLAVSATISGAEGSTLGPQQGRSGVEDSAG